MYTFGEEAAKEQKQGENTHTLSVLSPTQVEAEGWRVDRYGNVESRLALVQRTLHIAPPGTSEDGVSAAD